MSYTRLPYEQNTVGLATFIVDTDSDIASLPTGNTPGSKAIVIDAGAEYILNNQHQWKLFSSNSGGSSSGGDSGMTQAQVQELIDNNISTLTDEIETLKAELAAKQDEIDHDSTQSGYVLAIDANGDIKPMELTAASGLVVSTTSGQNTYEVSSYTGRDDNDYSYLYECTAQSWSSFSVQDGEQVKFKWNRLTYTVYVSQQGEDFVLGDRSGTDPYIIMTHRQDLGINKLIAKVYNPSNSAVKDQELKIITGIPQTTDNLTLRANGYNYRVYIDQNGALQVKKVS